MKTGLVLRWSLHYDNRPRRTSPGRQYSTFGSGTQSPFASVSGRKHCPTGVGAVVVGGGLVVSGHPAGDVCQPDDDPQREEELRRWRTGTQLLSAPGTKRNAELFLAHLDDLAVGFAASQ
jgi:hypothetical protein